MHRASPSRISHVLSTRLLPIGPALFCATLLATSPVARPADYLAMSGEQLYRRFCASCHGLEGRGDGPVAKSLIVEVPDLTRIARRQGPAYSRDRIERIIDGRFLIGAHGTRLMPVWGENFARTELGNPDAERAVDAIITRLTDYIEGMQRRQ